MDPISDRLLQQLDVEVATREEAAAVRDQIPPEPWPALVVSAVEATAEWVRGRLRTGYRHAPALAIEAAKGSSGFRPIPTLSVLDRIAYRALTTWILKDLEKFDRSPEAYKNCVTGPIQFAFAQTADDAIRLNDPALPLRYVLEADIAAFYEYVDHGVLRQELEIQTGKREAIDSLMSLLEGTQGRAFGLPQMLDPSDWLSEVYISILERDLTRRGLLIWRYSDDFRIACRTYPEVVEAIESLHERARAIGLTVSDYKTRTPQFWTYVLQHVDDSVDPNADQVEQSDVEAVVADYADADEEFQVARAISVVEGINVDEERKVVTLLTAGDEPSPPHLRETRSEGIRDVRRALNALGKAGNAAALPVVGHLLTFLPSLTPRVVVYLQRLFTGAPSEVQATVANLTKLPIGEWQALWLVSLIRSLGAESCKTNVEWLRTQSLRGALVGAEATLALAEIEAVGFREIESALRREPEVLAPWFLASVRAAKQWQERPSDPELKAIRGASPLTRLLVGE